MAKCGFRKDKTGFSYYGDLHDCLEYAKSKLAKLKLDTAYISRRYIEEKRKFDAHNKAIASCERFIELVKIEIEKQKGIEENG